jgi:AraC-like DNA-binding protein
LNKNQESGYSVRVQQMSYRIVYPQKILAAFVKYYWVYENSGLEEQRVIPTGDTQILFHYGQPFREINGSGRSLTQPRTCVCGQITGYRDVQAEGRTGMVGVVFKPYGLARFLPMPAGELTDRSLGYHDLDTGFKELESRVGEANDPELRIRAIGHELEKRLAECDQDGLSQVIYTVNRIISAGGRVRVARLLSETETGERKLERLFFRYVGLTPRQLITFVKLNHALSLIKSAERLTDVAYDAGYFDQAHFIKAFKAHTGLTPKLYKKAG